MKQEMLGGGEEQGLEKKAEAAVRATKRGRAAAATGVTESIVGVRERGGRLI